MTTIKSMNGFTEVTHVAKDGTYLYTKTKNSVPATTSTRDTVDIPRWNRNTHIECENGYQTMYTCMPIQSPIQPPKPKKKKTRLQRIISFFK